MAETVEREGSGSLILCWAIVELLESNRKMDFRFFRGIVALVVRNFAGDLKGLRV